MATLDKEIQILMLKGQKGDTGRSIESIVKTSSVGDTDTYTITYTDGTTTTFQVENGISQQELETALAPVNSNISSLQQGKVDKIWQSEEEVDENNEIQNNASGIQLSSNATDCEGRVLVQSHQVKLEASSENNTEEQLDYNTNLTITDTDIIVNRDLGNGNVETASLFDLVGIAGLKNKTIYTNTLSTFPISYNAGGNYSWVSLSEAVSDGDVLEIYCAIRIFNDSNVYKFIGRIQIYTTATLSNPTSIFYPMFKTYIDNKEVGMIDIRFIRHSTTNNTIGVLIRNQGEAGSTEMSSSSGVKLRIEKVVKIVN